MNKLQKLQGHPLNIVIYIFEERRKSLKNSPWSFQELLTGVCLFKLLSRQVFKQFSAVGRQHFIIGHAVINKHLAFEVFNIRKHWRCFLHFRYLIGITHVTLCVMRVIKSPVCNWCPRNTHLEVIRVAKHGHLHLINTIPASINADTLWVNKCWRTQVLYPCDSYDLSSYFRAFY